MKRTCQATLICSLLAATGTTASADIFTWLGGNGNWNDASRWSGPANEYPNSILDTAFINGENIDIILDTNLSLAQLSIFNGADVYAPDQSIFVAGNTTISGSSTTLVIQDTPTLRDLDTDTLQVANGGLLVLNGGIVQIDVEAVVGSESAILGTGVVELNSTTGDLVIDSGTLWSIGNQTNVNTLTVQRTQSSTSKLDWTDANANLAAWGGTQGGTLMDLHIPFVGALGGTMQIIQSSQIASEYAIIASSNSEISLHGGELLSNDRAILEAPLIELYGSISISEQCVLDSPFVILRGTGAIGEESELKIEATAVIFDSFDMSSFDDEEGGLIRFGNSTNNLNIINGTTTISTGIGGQFDLDGPSNMEVNIDADSALVLDVQYIERSGSNLFDSVLNIEGSLDVVSVVEGVKWTNATGTINLDGGEIHGRVLVNESLIQGFGLITSTVLNQGTIISDGSTLFFGALKLGGTIRAETGDISVVNNSQGLQIFQGDLYVGNGNGNQEVFEINNGIIFSQLSKLSINSGRIRGAGLHLHSEFITQGTSQLRAVGNGGVGRIRFEDASANTISGTLEIDGGSVVHSGAQFLGEGTIVAVHTGKTMNLFNGTNFQDVGLTNHGTLAIVEFLGEFSDGVGQAAVANLTLANTSKLQIDLAGENNDEVEYDQLTVLDEATIDGVLELSVVDGHSVSFGEVYTILTAGSVAGTFSSVDISGLAIGQSAQVQMYDDHVDVLVTCRADLHADGQLNFFDVSAFLSAFAMNDPIADFTNDGSFNFFDVSAFLQSYGAGCP